MTCATGFCRGTWRLRASETRDASPNGQFRFKGGYDLSLWTAASGSITAVNVKVPMESTASSNTVFSRWEAHVGKNGRTAWPNPLPERSVWKLTLTGNKHNL